MAEAQKTDDALQKLLSNKQTSLQLKNVTIPGGDTELICDVSGNSIRPFVPNKFRTIIIDKLHQLSHPGIRATIKLVQQRFVWPNMHKDCKQFVQHCIPCQRAKIHRHTKSPIVHYDTTSDRFEHVNIDLVGPLPESKGYSYLLTCIDRATRWTEAIPLADIPAVTVTKALISGWIARFGIPKRITTDQGRQFESILFNQLNNTLGTDHMRTTTYNPKANGIIERWHRTLKASIKTKFIENWIDELPMILLGLRSIVKEDLKASPAELTYGKTLNLPGQFFSESKEQITDVDFVKKFKRMMNKVRPTETTFHDKPSVFIHPKLQTAKYVFVRVDSHKTPLQAPYNGPFEVLNHGENFFKLNIKGKNQNVSIDRLKPAFVEMSVEDAANQQKNATKTTNTFDESEPQPQSTTTRSGRRVKIPDRITY